MHEYIKAKQREVAGVYYEHLANKNIVFIWYGKICYRDRRVVSHQFSDRLKRIYGCIVSLHTFSYDYRSGIYEESFALKQSVNTPFTILQSATSYKLHMSINTCRWLIVDSYNKQMIVFVNPYLLAFSFSIGMMPLYLWIGNPFCFPCIPLRLVIVLPAGLIALVMTLGPVFGIAERRLIPFAPPEMLAQIKNVGSTFFSIGMIFWAIFGIIGVMSFLCWYRFCREGAENTADCGCC